MVCGLPARHRHPERAMDRQLVTLSQLLIEALLILRLFTGAAVDRA
jgi:hypothetical protein